jgi:hypothetical protein
MLEVQDQDVSRNGLFWRLAGAYLLSVSSSDFSFYACVLISSFKDMGYIGEGPIPMF